MVLESVAAGFPPIIFISIYSFLLLIIINIFYRVLVNQSKAKQTNDLIADLSKKMKENQKSGNTEDFNPLRALYSPKALAARKSPCRGISW